MATSPSRHPGLRRGHRPTSLWCCGLAALGVFAACGGDDAPEGGGAGATGGADGGGGSAGAAGLGGEGGADGGLCPASGVSKRPWAQTLAGTSVRLRWEACRPGVNGTLEVAEEGGTARWNASSTVTEHVVASTYTAPLNPNAPPDEAGTYWLHEVLLEDLPAGRCYTYRLGADASHEGRFCTSPPSGTPFSFLVLGDTNPGLAQVPQRLFPRLADAAWDFSLHVGDVQYYDSGFDTWAYWFPAMTPLLARGAFMPSIGNHEHERPGEFESYYGRFFDRGGAEGSSAYYFFEHGGVYFFALDTEQPAGPGSTQAGWLSTRLEAASARPGYRFSVVYFHKPFLTCGDTGQNDPARTAMTPAFEQHGVRLVIQGHMHGYERFVVPRNDDATKTITYVTAAGGGGLLGNVDENDERETCALRVERAKKYHALLVDVGPGAVSGRAIDPDGVEIDRFTQPLD